MAKDWGDVASGVLVLMVIVGIICYALGWFMCKAELLGKILDKRKGDDDPREPSSGGSNGD